jgi:hypothetical protein
MPALMCPLTEILVHVWVWEGMILKPNVGTDAFRMCLSFRAVTDETCSYGSEN